MTAMTKSSAIAACALAAALGTTLAYAEPKMSSGTATQVRAITEQQAGTLATNFSASRVQLTQKDGEQIYQAICQGCHMVQGKGAQGVGFYPPLASNPKLAAAAYPLTVVMNGLHGMPGFSHRLSNEQVASVVNYVRTSFGNNFQDNVRPEDVQVFRK
ncbi:c-type cytochrome [Pseudorhodoferax soli]|uniref:Mono/diheme cytochrome c family protein n=1 Tax=Pseudorhodoferax soli TaxID=545864 RepID=A0A368XL35_9BURK|nr:cytochrome c [Pseudorhodoferax soli]RCW68620.1 mono/diheme cytochrome c family protein [Pseudorhodoferax soli]